MIYRDIVSAYNDKELLNDYYLSFIKETTLTNNIFGNRGGEENEVSEVKWIPLDELDNYQWAFDHKHLIKKITEEYGEKDYISRY